MSKTPLNLTRNQISSIVGENPRAVRAFELLIQQVNDILPTDVATILSLIQESSLDAGTADAKAVAATDAVNRLAAAVEQLAARPLQDVGSMAQLNSDNVDLIGFNRLVARTVGKGQMAWNPADGCLDIGMGYDGVTQQVGLESYYRIKASGAITNGQLVMFDGSVGASGVLKGKPSVASISNGQLIMGVATMDMALNDFGYVTNFGLVRGINTSGSLSGETWHDGDVIYYNPAGGGLMTNVQPSAPNDKIVVAAVVNASSGGSGSLFIRPNFYPHLSDLSDVYSASPTDGDKLIYNGTTGRWEKDSRSYLMLE